MIGSTIPVEALNLKAGLGAEGSKDKPEGGEDSETETELAIRIGAGWEFPFGSRFEITPEVNLDFVGGKTIWVYGVCVGTACTKSGVMERSGMS